MKKKLIYFAGFLLIASSVSSCEGLFQICKTCKYVTYEGGNVISEGSPVEYCGDDLLVIEATPPVVTGNLTTKYECR